MQRAIALAITVMSCASLAHPGEMRWTPLGADGGVVFDLATDPINPSRLYIGTWCGRAFISTNGGLSWQESTVDPGGSAVAAIQPSPLVDGLVLAATRNHQVWRSTDGGSSWGPPSDGLDEFTVGLDQKILFHPYDATVVYWQVPDSQCSLFKSADLGASWSCISDPLPAESAHAFFLDPSAPHVLYTMMYNAGVYVSTNGGATWAPANDGLPTGVNESLGTDALVMDPSAPNRLYASSDIEHQIYASSDGGASWDGAGGEPLDILELWHHRSENRLYGATWDESDPNRPMCLWESTDGGASWTNLTPGTFQTDWSEVVVDVSDPSTLFATISGGVFRSTDYGTSWIASSSGFRGQRVISIEFSPSDADRFYYGGRGGLFRSTDGGSSFTPINSGFSQPFGEALSVHPNDPLEVLSTGLTPHGAYVGWPCGGSYSCEQSGIARSTDGGESWVPIPNPAYPDGGALYQVWGFDRDPVDPSTVYAANPFYNWQAEGHEAGPFVSTDSGQSFTHLGADLPDEILLRATFIFVVEDTPGPTLLLGTDSNGILFRSTDGGATWADVTTGTELEGLAFREMVSDPSAPSTLFMAAGRSAGVYRSDDAGASWSPAGDGLPEDPENPGESSVYSLAVDPERPQVLYAGVSAADGVHGGVWWSGDAGTSWRRLALGMGDLVTWELKIDPLDNLHILAGTGNGLWEIRLNEGLLFVDDFETMDTSLWSAAVGG